MSERDYALAQAEGAVPVAPIDRADGYIHLSTDDQLLDTARLHFAGRDDLVTVEFDAAALGPLLKWESSRGGALFPHYFGALSMSLARAARRLIRCDDGSFVIGEVLS